MLDRALERTDADSARVGNASRGGPALARMGNRAMISTLSALGSAGVAVSRPSDPVEVEADQVADRVSGGTEVEVDAELSVAGAAGGGQRGGAPAPPAPPATPPGLPPTITAALTGGVPLQAALRSRLEPAVGADLSGLRVHSGPAARVAAESVGARAFTLGESVVLGAGESSDDVGLMAHEATHVAQQTGGVARLVLMRDEDDDGGSAADTDDSLIPDWIMDGVRSAVRSLPGYAVVTAAVGHDLLTGEQVTGGPADMIEQVLTEGPFGSGIAVVLRSLDVLDQVVTMVTDALAVHNLTLARIRADIAAAWEEFSAANLIDGNVAIARRYVESMLADVSACVTDLIDTILTRVRQLVVDLVEPYLTEGALAPVWSLARKVIHYDPLRGEGVDAPTVEILGDFLRLIGQDQLLARMTEEGTLAKTAEWLDVQILTFRGLIETGRALFADAWAAISPANLPGLLDTLPELASRALGLFTSVSEFAGSVLGQVIALIKDALLSKISERAQGLRGYRLLTVILGQDPFTQQQVDRNATNLIGGFISLLPGGEATFAQLSESGVIAEAAGRIESEMTRLNISWELITGTFRAIWDGLQVEDVLDPFGTIARVLDQFGEPLGRIISFVGTVVRVVIELVLRLMNFPSDLLGSIISTVSQAVDDITNDPIGFLNNLLAAVKQGFGRFFDNIGGHLLHGLADWLFRGLRGLGITIPTDLSGEAILNLVLEVLGLSVDFLWERLALQIGPERVATIRGAIDRLGQAWAFVADVQERGMAAIWDYVSSQLGNLWETILSATEQWLMSEIIEAAIAKVLSMLDPTGVMAVVNSFIAFFRAVQSVIDYITEIMQIVNTYVQTIGAIARGDISPGAAMLETGLAQAVPVAIGFLASQVGLGNVPEKITEIIQSIRGLVEQAIDWLIAQALRLGRAALDALGLGGEQDPAAAPVTPVTEAQHPAYARTAADQLIAAVRADHGPPLDAARQFATAHEESLSAPLADGIRLRFVLPAGDAVATGELIFHVVIAPNTTDLTATTPLAATADTPLASAPGIGDQIPYRSRQTRNRDGARIWHLTAEHIVPFDLGREVWAAATAGTPVRRGWEDNEQMTLLIYRDAADIKTNGPDPTTGLNERQISQAFAAAMRSVRHGVDLAVVMSGEINRGVDTPSSTEHEDRARELVDVISTALDRARDISVTRTNAAITQEHGVQEAGFPITNGARRAEASPIPGGDAVRSTAHTQTEQLKAMVTRTLLSEVDAAAG